MNRLDSAVVSHRLMTDSIGALAALDVRSAQSYSRVVHQRACRDNRLYAMHFLHDARSKNVLQRVSLHDEQKACLVMPRLMLPKWVRARL